MGKVSYELPVIHPVLDVGTRCAGHTIGSPGATSDRRPGRTARALHREFEIMTSDEDSTFWVIDTRRSLADHLVTDAAASQASLEGGIVALRHLRVEFPNGVGPGAAERWIATGGSAHPPRGAAG